jgi:hypothetical protein
MSASRSTRSGAKLWDTDDIFDDADVSDVEEYGETEATGVGEFASVCPCCGTLTVVRLFCTATAIGTESGNE